jgi:hypothetical protein
MARRRRNRSMKEDGRGKKEKCQQTKRGRKQLKNKHRR